MRKGAFSFVWAVLLLLTALTLGPAAYAQVPIPESSSDPSAHPGSLYLPPGVAPTTTPDRDPPKSEGAPMGPSSSSGWQEIKREDETSVDVCDFDAGSGQVWRIACARRRMVQ